MILLLVELPNDGWIDENVEAAPRGHRRRRLESASLVMRSCALCRRGKCFPRRAIAKYPMEI